MSSPRDLIENPCWDARDLGHALPDSPHAVSVALPRWQDIMNYEERDPSCLKKLKAVYPRFGLNPLVDKVSKHALDIHSSRFTNAWPYPTNTSAEEARKYCDQVEKNGVTAVFQVLGLHCLLTDDLASGPAKSFWQHVGLGASSREASIALGIETRPTNKTAKESKNKLVQRLSKIYGCSAELIQLHPSGMAAFNNALRAITKINPGRQILQLGFPYVDVLKLPQRIFEGSNLLLSTDIDIVEKALHEKEPSAIVVELPSNPMLQCIDLPNISKLAHERDIPVIADDTIGSALNIDALKYSDIVFSSLTKSFAGSGDVLAGSLVINPNSKWKESLTTGIKEILAPLADSDAIALEEASRDVIERIPKLNNACLNLAKRLESHPSVARILHPGQCQNFKKIMRPGGGSGCLFSFELKEGLEHAKKFYDNLKTCKGPSLGTNFTLVCPYVMLAHYDELDWAHRCGVPSHLIRVSVGLEDHETLWQKFRLALEIEH